MGTSHLLTLVLNANLEQWVDDLQTKRDSILIKRVLQLIIHDEEF